MRGLTAPERTVLEAATLPDSVSCYFDTVTARAQARIGRVTWKDDPEAQVEWLHITDLGRLALRVCPPGDA